MYTLFDNLILILLWNKPFSKNCFDQKKKN